ncbi:type II secretion system F family protein [Actinomarinicola tropica]|uniref:Type II secretion system F family protein n=1 Tax=Actinomarinicola tropica TaxID=2789776 RepID=A0A5Q2RF45_9ACTN|nr:type II secretion system F family protein [Actinomarinicola tropica]QGG95478.1 type II secretion system F family protein [Actinomarinicola tropica]
MTSDLPLELVVIGIGVAIGLAIYFFLSQAEDRSVVRDSLRQLDGYEVENVRDQELLNPLSDRAIKPVLQGLTGLGRRFTPVGYVDQVKQKLIRSGKAGPDAADRFLAVRVITVALVPVVFVVWYLVNPLGMDGMMQHAVFGFAAFALIAGPDAILNRNVEARQYELRRQLPDIMDILVISVEAGLGFEQAIDRVVQSVPGALSDEFSRMLGEVRAGSSRADAMRALEERTDVPEIRSFVLSILQADTFGVSIGRVLRSQADEMRIKRRQLAQERAQKAPVKMMVPMVFCVFPALFVVVLGPAIINIRESFS